MHGRFHDSAISVREASIDLVGRFLIIQRDLTAQYYPMLSERILVSQTCCCLFYVKMHYVICCTHFILVSVVVMKCVLQQNLINLSKCYFGMSFCH